MIIKNLEGLKKVDHVEYKASSKEFIKQLEESDYKIHGLETLKKDIDYLMKKDYAFALWIEEDDVIKFEW